MNKYQKAEAWIKEIDENPDWGHTSIDWEAIDELKEILEKATPKKAITLAVVNRGCVINYHCPVCGEWLSCDYEIEPDELDCFCSKCGQHVMGVTEDE